MADIGIMISSGVAGAVLTALTTILTNYWKARQPKRLEPIPLPIEKHHECISVQECNRRMAEMAGRIDQFFAALERITAMIDDLDKKDESRICSLNQRVDALVEKVSSTAGSTEIIRDAFFKASYGGVKK